MAYDILMHEWYESRFLIFFLTRSSKNEHNRDVAEVKVTHINSGNLDHSETCSNSKKNLPNPATEIKRPKSATPKY